MSCVAVVDATDGESKEGVGVSCARESAGKGDKESCLFPQAGKRSRTTSRVC